MIIDLTADIMDGALAPPGDPPYSITPHSDIATDGFNLSKVTFGTHQGTHIDAPSHMIDGAQSISDIPASRFVVLAVMANLSHLPRGSTIDIAHLLPYKSDIKPGMGIIIQTGWDKHLNTNQYFTDSPCISPKLAAWFVDKQIGLLGIDMPCPCAADWQRVHKTLLGGDILIVEGLVNLSALNSDPFTFCALPLKLIGADGSPARAIAITD
ncbi:MAG: cyclase family protein [Clostridia bacterium]|jgi:arylformamidase|nr:cyclase family protein [Clostridia bacterium]MBT7123101.1 cyclase family protein [Clostridia bacterium]